MTTLGTPAGTAVVVGDHRMLIDGELRTAAAGGPFEVVNPATGEVAGEAADGTVADMDLAIGAARRAFGTSRWSRDVEFRYRCLVQLRDALAEEQERLRRIVITEAGTPIATTHAIQLGFGIIEAGYWPEYGRGFEYWRETAVPGGLGGRAVRIDQYDPVGVVGAITTWDCPLARNIAECLPALMAGNAVVLKPSRLTPWSGTELGRIVATRTGIPPGIFSVVTSSTAAVGVALAADPRVDAITFTGSAATGREVLAAAAPTGKKVFLKLGGTSSHIVLDDADLAECLPAACWMSGQPWTRSSRILLPRSRYAEGVEILKATTEALPYGDPWDPTVLHGPQISQSHRQRVLDLIRSGPGSGARLVTGGGVPAHLPRGWFIEPTLLSDVDPASRIAGAEICGPVLIVSAYGSEDEAVAIANSAGHGGTGEVSSADDKRALRVAARVRAVAMAVNGGSHVVRRRGQGFEKYLEIKTIGVPA
jgi:aldehyde dehydrogenase (NAD+)